MILPTWFDPLQERFSYKEVQIKNFCPSLNLISPPAEIVNETHVNVLQCIYGTFIPQHLRLTLPQFLHQSCLKLWTRPRSPPCRLKWLQFKFFPSLPRGTYSTFSTSLLLGSFRLSQQQILALLTRSRLLLVKCHLLPYRWEFESHILWRKQHNDKCMLNLYNNCNNCYTIV